MSLNLIPQLGDILWVVTGFVLGFIALALLTAAWWAEARRNDRQNNELAVHAAQIRRLRALAGDRVAGQAEPPATDEQPAVDKPRPTPGPRTVPTEQAIAVAAPDLLEQWRAKRDQEIAAWRAGLEAK